MVDYSFDSIPERDKRLNEALKQIRNVYSIGKDGIIDWYKNNVDKIEYNRNKFFTYSFSKMIDETITDLKKFKKDII